MTFVHEILDNHNGDDGYKNKRADEEVTHNEEDENRVFSKQPVESLEDPSDDQGKKNQQPAGALSAVGRQKLENQDSHEKQVVVNCRKRKLDVFQDDQRTKIQRISSGNGSSENIDDANEKTKSLSIPDEEAMNPKFDYENEEYDEKIKAEETMEINQDDEEEKIKMDDDIDYLFDDPIASTSQNCSIFEEMVERDRQFEVILKNKIIKEAISKLKKEKFPTRVRLATKSIYNERTKKFDKKTVISFTCVPFTEIDGSCYVPNEQFDENLTEFPEPIVDELESYFLPLKLSEKPLRSELILPSIDLGKLDKDNTEALTLLKTAAAYGCLKSNELLNLNNKTPTQKSYNWICKILRLVVNEIHASIEKAKKSKGVKTLLPRKTVKKRRTMSKENVNVSSVIQEKKLTESSSGPKTSDTSLMTLDDNNLSNKTFLAEPKVFLEPKNVDERNDDFNFAVPMTVAEFNARRKARNSRKFINKTVNSVSVKESMLNYWSDKIGFFFSNEIQKATKNQKYRINLIRRVFMNYSREIKYYELNAYTDGNL